MESGRIEVSEETIATICLVLPVNKEWLMTGVGDREARVDQVDDKLIAWLNEHPEIIQELRIRNELD